AGPWPSQRPEDWDVEARMGAVGARLGNCNSTVSCHRQHDSGDRVTDGDQEAYLLDEAWFLPRLYRCALQAGVGSQAPAINRFARWVFMRARYLAGFGHRKQCFELLQLAKTADPSLRFQVACFAAVARVCGVRYAGRAAAWYDMRRA
ncbi:MAG: hypothetical protein HOM55_02070, partial [Proteobacteria bacterium]|nr:hypothetical protein [Pseudomonadota bacterium]